MTTTGAFCEELRARTQNAHNKSDKIINLKLAVVLTDLQLYGKAVAEFYFVMSAIQDSVMRYCYDTNSRLFSLAAVVNEINITNLFEKDLEYFLGTNWKQVVTPSKEVSTYIDRIHEVATEKPILLISYVHSMFLALLSGGQLLSRIIQRTLGLDGERGLEIFQFRDFDKNALKLRLKSCINDIELSFEEKEEIIKEKIRIFEMNNAVAHSIPTSLHNYYRLAKLGFLVLCTISLWAVLYSGILNG